MRSKRNIRNRRLRSGHAFTSIDNGHVVKVPFRALYTQAATNTTATTVTETNLVVANLGPRIVAIADEFTQWRLSSLTVKSTLINQSAAAAGITDAGSLHMIAFTPTNPADFVTPTTLAMMDDFPHFDYGNYVKQLSIHMNSNDLYKETPSRWYFVSTADTSENSAGAVEMVIQNGAAGASVSFGQYVELRGICEFRGPVNPSLVPLKQLENRLQRLTQEVEEKKKIVVKSKLKQLEENDFVMDIGPSSPPSILREESKTNRYFPQPSPSALPKGDRGKTR